MEFSSAQMRVSALQSLFAAHGLSWTHGLMNQMCGADYGGKFLMRARVEPYCSQAESAMRTDDKVGDERRCTQCR